MGITFKQFASIVAEGKTTYSSQSYWKGDAEAAGYTIKKLSGELSDGDQTWGAFNDKDEKVGEFTEKEENRGGWLVEGQINEIFGMFRNNQKHEKAKADREQLKKDTADLVNKHRAKQAAEQAKKNGQGKGEDVEDDDEDDPKKKTTSATRSASTRGTRTTQSAAQGRAAERDWLKNM